MFLDRDQNREWVNAGERKSPLSALYRREAGHETRCSIPLGQREHRMSIFHSFGATAEQQLKDDNEAVARIVRTALSAFHAALMTLAAHRPVGVLTRQ